MNILYLECNMGAAGDMLMSALYELLEDKEAFIWKMNHLGISGVELVPKKTDTCQITGTRIEVTIHGEEEESIDVHHEQHAQQQHDLQHAQQQHDLEHHHHETNHHHQHEAHHHHRSFSDIINLIESLPLPDKVICDAIAVYKNLAAAESKVHGKSIEEVHFHEVGTLDAVADIVGVCYAMYLLQVEKVIVSPIHVGKGQVQCAHGIVPVPAPATAELLLGVPVYSGDIQGELCTPTGAALLTYFADSYGGMPAIVTKKCGYGLGKKSFAVANCIRAFLGQAAISSEPDEATDEITELCCNIDDMTPEALGFACEALMKAGALDVYVIPVQMKKGRCGMLLTLLCREKQINEMAKHIFMHTSTNGIRVKECKKLILEPGKEMITTPYGVIGIKTAKGYGVSRKKPEYDDVAKIAASQKIPFKEVWDAAVRMLNQ